MKKIKLSVSLASILAISALSGPVFSIHKASAASSVLSNIIKANAERKSTGMGSRMRSSSESSNLWGRPQVNAETTYPTQRVYLATSGVDQDTANAERKNTWIESSSSSSNSSLYFSLETLQVNAETTYPTQRAYLAISGVDQDTANAERKNTGMGSRMRSSSESSNLWGRPQVNAETTYPTQRAYLAISGVDQDTANAERKSTGMGSRMRSSSESSNLWGRPQVNAETTYPTQRAYLATSGVDQDTANAERKNTWMGSRMRSSSESSNLWGRPQVNAETTYPEEEYKNKITEISTTDSESEAAGYPLEAAGYPLETVGYPLEAVGYPLKTVGYPLEAAGYPLEAAGYPLEAAGYPLETVGYPLEAVGYPLKTVGYPLEAAGYPLEAAGYPLEAAGYPLETVGYPYSELEGEKTSNHQIMTDRVGRYSMAADSMAADLSCDKSTGAIIITDDQSGTRIIADSKSMDQFITDSGEWNEKFIKKEFDKKYIQEAQKELTTDPKKHEEVFKQLVSRKVDLDGIELNNDDIRVAQLKDEDKALVYLLLTSKSDVDFEKQKIKEMSMISSGISSDIVRTAFNTINSRLASLTAGIGASSDESEKKAFALNGAWVSGIYAEARQKAYGEVAGYKGKSGGGTVGVDFSVNDEKAIIGTSYSKIVSNITGNSYSKIKAVSNILSIYTKIYFGNKFDLSAVLAGNNTRFTHKYPKMTGPDYYQTTTSDFTSNGLNAQMLLNYNMALSNNFMVMPMVGMQYRNEINSAYTESGAGVHNLSIAASNSKGFSGVAGVELSKRFLVGNIHVIPSLLATVQKDFTRDTNKIKSHYVWASGLSTETHAFNRGRSLGYNLGAGLGINHKNVEVLAEYNCHLKKKYVGYQGTLKLKFLF